MTTQSSVNDLCSQITGCKVHACCTRHSNFHSQSKPAQSALPPTSSSRTVRRSCTRTALTRCAGNVREARCSISSLRCLKRLHGAQGAIWMPRTCRDHTAPLSSVRQGSPFRAAITCCPNTEWPWICDKARSTAVIDMLVCIAPCCVPTNYQAWPGKTVLPKTWLHAQ